LRRDAVPITGAIPRFQAIYRQEEFSASDDADVLGFVMMRRDRSAGRIRREQHITCRGFELECIERTGKLWQGKYLRREVGHRCGSHVTSQLRRDYASEGDFDVKRVVISRAFCKKRLAHTNSVASIERPIGMITNAGPGKTISAIPIRVTVPPTTATTIRLAIRSFECWSFFT
jgi:hypothetical protein